MSLETITEIAKPIIVNIVVPVIISVGHSTGIWRWLRRMVRDRFSRPQNRRPPQGRRPPRK